MTSVDEYTDATGAAVPPTASTTSVPVTTETLVAREAPVATSQTTELEKPAAKRPSTWAALGTLLSILSALLGLFPVHALRLLFSKSALGLTQDTSHGSAPLAHAAKAGLKQAWNERTQPAWNVGTADPKLSLLLKLLVSLVASGLASAGLVSILVHGARLRKNLNVDIYNRLLQALAVYGVSNALLVGLNFTNFRLLPWGLLLGLFGSIAASAARPLWQQYNSTTPVRKAAALKPSARNWRGALYGALAIYLFFEGPAVLFFPKTTLEGLFNLSGGAVGRVLWQLIGTGVHTIVPAAILNLKPLADQHNLDSTTSALLNTAALVPGVVHLSALARAFFGGLTGKLLPLIAAVWTLTTLFSLVNIPLKTKAVHQD